MLRASGFGRPSRMAWARRPAARRAGAGFGTRPIRVAAGVAVTALLLLNAVLVLRLSRDEAAPRASHVPQSAAREGEASTFKELRESLHGVQVSLKAQIQGSTLEREQNRPDQGDGPRGTSTQGSVSGSTSTGSSSGSTSTGSSGGTAEGAGGSDSPPPDEEPPATGDGGGTVPGGGGGGGTGGGGSGGGDPSGGGSGGGGGGG